MGTTEKQPQTHAVSSMNVDPHPTKDEYPRLTPKAGDVKREDNSDLYPDPYLQQPMRGPAYGGAPYGPTNSSTREQRAKDMQRVMDVEDSLIADGQDPANPDLTKGTHTGRGVNEPTKSADELKDDLLRADGADDFGIALDRQRRPRY